jgi:hypothetical protein
MELVSSKTYENALITFHRSLYNFGVKGYIGSQTFKIEGAYWMGASESGYEDWYLLKDSSVMDKLNQAAVSGSVKDPHNTAAHMATSLHAGLYVIKSPYPSFLSGKSAVWFTKPREMDLNQILSNYGNSNDNIGDLWMRLMVLGPTPEYCIVSENRIELPENLHPVNVKRKPISDFIGTILSSY